MDDTITTTSLTESLGIRGWSHLDPVLLAALALQSPTLLIGPHGTGKSQLIEALSQALLLKFRHYNASLLNYDDLIGIPMPNDDGTELHFIKSEGTIWGAEFVFLDEISRCRADLQNKLFPIIHERKVVGIKLENLRHRWAAMNPPAPEELEAVANSAHYYMGSEPLDPALTDRFYFIIKVPTWTELSKSDRRELVSWRENDDPFDAPNPPNFAPLVEQTAALVPQLEGEFQEWLADYVVCLVDMLEVSGLPQSPRRARMLARSIVAVHAARMVLEGEDVDVERSAEIAVVHGLPQTATDTPPNEVKVVATHRQAWDLAQQMDDESWRQVIEESDPARRVALADELGFNDESLSRLITQTLSNEDSDPRQIGLAVAMFLKYSTGRNLDPSAFEPLAQLAYHVMQPRVITYTVQANSPEATIWSEIQGWINGQANRVNSLVYRMQRNYLLLGFPEFWRKMAWKDALNQFTQDLETFGITDETQQ